MLPLGQPHRGALTLRVPMPRRPPLVVQPVRNGRGLVACRPFAPGDLVLRVLGRRLHADEVWRLWDRDPRRAANCFRIGPDHYLDPHGRLGAFANHSCRPNVAVAKERGTLALRAIDAIGPGDEVLHDYSTLLGADDVWTMRCNCGERSCRGTVRSFHRLPAAASRRYLRLGAIPGFIRATR